MSEVVKREDLSGMRIGVDYADRGREMAYATVRDGKVIEGHIGLGPKYVDDAPTNLSRLATWAEAVREEIERTTPDHTRGEGEDG